MVRLYGFQRTVVQKNEPINENASNNSSKPTVKSGMKKQKITQSDILTFLAREKQELERQYRVAKIGLFGSYARGEETEDSDIDIILEFLPQTENLTEIKSSLKALIMKEFGKDVDICREKYLKPYYRNQILKSAIYV